MKRERFLELVRQALDSLPAAFRARMENIAVVVEDRPPADLRRTEDEEGLLMGVFDGVPTTEKSVWDSAGGPDRVVLFQRNIEEFARDAAAEEGRPVEEIIREEVRLTVLHEIGHYFGMDEDQLADV